MNYMRYLKEFEEIILEKVDEKIFFCVSMRMNYRNNRWKSASQNFEFRATISLYYLDQGDNFFSVKIPKLFVSFYSKMFKTFFYRKARSYIVFVNSASNRNRAKFSVIGVWNNYKCSSKSAILTRQIFDWEKLRHSIRDRNFLLRLGGQGDLGSIIFHNFYALLQMRY